MLQLVQQKRSITQRKQIFCTKCAETKAPRHSILDWVETFEEPAELKMHRHSGDSHNRLIKSNRSQIMLLDI